MAALGIVSLLLLAGLRLATLARAPGATANAVAQLDAAIALARSLARGSGNGATLLLLPRTDARGAALPGFRIVLYRGRPSVAGAATLARELPLVADASLREASLGAPPFALFFRRDGTAVGSAHPVLSGAPSDPQFAPIAAEPPCPNAAGIVLEIARNGATATRAIPCPKSPNASVLAPQPSMTPNPPTLAPRALLFHWPHAPEKWFAIAEFGYRRWFAATGGAMQGFACIGGGAAVVAFPSAPPYSGPQSAADAQSSPTPPNAPYAYAVATSSAPGAMDDAPAHFPVRPVGAGLCRVPLVDAFARRTDPWGNSLDVTVQVMGWLTLSQGGNSATSQTPPLATTPQLTSGQPVTIAASKADDNDPAGIVPSITSWNPASCASVFSSPAIVSNTPGSNPRATATTVFSLTDSTPPSSALTCTGTVNDQYDETPGVAFTVNVAAAASGYYALADVAVSSGGTTGNIPCALATLAGQGNGCNMTVIALAPVPQSPLVALETRVAPWINDALGGGVAAACSGCIPQPKPIISSCYKTSSCALTINPSSGDTLTTPAFTQTGQTWSFTVGFTYGRAVTVTSSDPSAVSVSPGTGTGSTTFVLTAGTKADSAVQITASTSSSSVGLAASLTLPTSSPSNCISTGLLFTSIGWTSTWTCNPGIIDQYLYLGGVNYTASDPSLQTSLNTMASQMGVSLATICPSGDLCVLNKGIGFSGTTSMPCTDPNACLIDPVPNACGTPTIPCNGGGHISAHATFQFANADLGAYRQQFVQVDASGNVISGGGKLQGYHYPYQTGDAPPNECEQLSGAPGVNHCLDQTLFDIPATATTYVQYPSQTTNALSQTKVALPYL